jgi:hypothetical protein
MTAILGLNAAENDGASVVMLADTEESLGGDAKSECDKLHRFTFGASLTRVGTVITGGAGDTHLIECANQEMERFLATAMKGKKPKDILSLLNDFARMFTEDTLRSYRGLASELVPEIPDLLIAINIPPQCWLFCWQGNRVRLIPQFMHTSIGTGIAQIHPMLRDVQFSGPWEMMLFHGLRMMFHAKRAVRGVGGKTEARILHHDGSTRFYGTDSTQRIEDVVRNFEEFCIKFLYETIANVRAPEAGVKEAFRMIGEQFPEFRKSYEKILNPR